jgi:rhamnosyltransferase subunit B
VSRILLGWEFGGNRGHARKIAAFARELRSSGHEVTLALQQLDSVDPDEVAGCAVWQAPLSPRLLINSARSEGRRAAATLGDILATLGLDSPELIASVVAAWREILRAVKPDVVCADYAPLLLLAARDLFPTVASGTGFDLPPPTLPAFPSLTGNAPASSEAETLASLNRALDRLAIRPLATLPEIFAASEAVVGTFSELDPYRDARTEPLVSPAVADSIPKAEAGGGEEVFVYGAVHIAANSPLWAGLAYSKLPIRVFVPNVTERYRQGLRDQGFIAEEAAVPFARIAARSRLLVSHGGHGFVCSGLLAGIPQVVCPDDLEKALIAAAVVRMGVGGASPLAAIKPEPFGVSLRQLYERKDVADRARAVAADLRGRNPPSLMEAMIAAVGRVA